MEFTYDAYRSLLYLLRTRGYVFTDYHQYAAYPRCVILRHDIDQSLTDAVRLAEIEAEEGIHSTWFMLLRTDFYNPASAASQKSIRRLIELGHEIGLHFDEVAYAGGSTGSRTRSSTEERILLEAKILSDICGQPITTVSMHRPSKATLESDLRILGIVNSYGKTFFHDFKYLSDSRCNWREPVLDIVRSGEYDRLHILTHAFWYHDTPRSAAETIADFVRIAPHERYLGMRDNIRDLEAVLREEEI